MNSKFNTNKILSICIPTWNRFQYLEKCLNSIFKETASLSYDVNILEIIVFDNNSSDETKLVLKKYKKNNNNLKLIKNK